MARFRQEGGTSLAPVDDAPPAVATSPPVTPALPVCELPPQVRPPSGAPTVAEVPPGPPPPTGMPPVAMVPRGVLPPIANVPPEAAIAPPTEALAVVRTVGAPPVPDASAMEMHLSSKHTSPSWQRPCKHAQFNEPKVQELMLVVPPKAGVPPLPTAPSLDCLESCEPQPATTRQSHAILTHCEDDANERRIVQTGIAEGYCAQ